VFQTKAPAQRRLALLLSLLGLWVGAAVVGDLRCRSAVGDGVAVAESTTVATGNATAGGAQAPLDTLLLLTYAERRGMRLFRHYCSVCHGEQCQGDGFNACNLDPKPVDLTDAKYQDAISSETLKGVVTHGGRGMNRSILTPVYGKTLSSDQITDVVAYLRTLAGPRNAGESPASR